MYTFSPAVYDSIFDMETTWYISDTRFGGACIICDSSLLDA